MLIYLEDARRYGSFKMFDGDVASEWRVVGCPEFGFYGGKVVFVRVFHEVGLAKSFLVKVGRFNDVYQWN